MAWGKRRRLGASVGGDAWEIKVTTPKFKTKILSSH